MKMETKEMRVEMKIKARWKMKVKVRKNDIDNERGEKYLDKDRG
jgi:hypothetical protein